MLKKYFFVAILGQIININSATIALIHKTNSPSFLMNDFMHSLGDIKPFQYCSSYDDQHMPIEKACWDHFPDEMKLIEESLIYTTDNLLHAILWGNPYFKIELSKEALKREKAAEKAIKKIRKTTKTHEFYEKIKEEYLRGCTACIDYCLSRKHYTFIFLNYSYLDISELQKYKEEGHKIFNVVAYCDLDYAFKMLVECNEIGVANNKNNKYHRYSREFLETFYKEFKPALEGEVVLEYVKKEEILKIFEYFEKNLNKTIFKRHGKLAQGELTQKSLNKLKEKIFSKFGFDFNDSVAITYSKPFDFHIKMNRYCYYIKTDTFGGAEAISKLMEKIK